MKTTYYTIELSKEEFENILYCMAVTGSFISMPKSAEDKLLYEKIIKLFKRLDKKYRRKFI